MNVVYNTNEKTKTNKSIYSNLMMNIDYKLSYTLVHHNEYINTYSSTFVALITTHTD